MARWIALLLAVASVHGFHPPARAVRGRPVYSNVPEGEIFDVDALVESLEKGDDKEPPREVKAQKPVDAKEIDAIIEDGNSDDDAFGGIPRAKGDW